LAIVARRSIRIIRKLIVAVLFTVLFVLLGIFSGLGYHVNRIEETSFVYEAQYADAAFSCDVTFNPFLYPYYWATGSGRINGNFSMIYVPDGYAASGRPFYAGNSADRYPEYLLYIVTWGTLPNLLALFTVTVVIEILGKRLIYLAFFLGALGFYLFVLEGLLLGVIIGSLLAVLLNSWRNNPLTRFWDSIWK
jgi:hypothetical protein